MANIISSKDSNLFKYARKLYQKANFRKKERKFVVEGLKEIEYCIKSNFIIDSIFMSHNKNYDNIKILNKKIYVVDEKLINEIVYRQSEGIFAIVNYKDFEISKVKLKKDELFLILEKPEKPGNIGAIMRTYEACGFKNLIIVDSSAEVYNPNTIRSSLGSIFYLNIFQIKSIDLIDFLKKNNFKIYSSFINSKKNYCKINFKDRCGIVMGPEKSSINSEFINKSDELFSLPMYGKVDSLNLSVATGIILYEALNQRKFS